MDPIVLARLQFGVTTVYHFFFVPLTLGLSVLVAIMETLYVRTGQDMYKRMTKFWGKLFLINFAMGVVTGIVQEFQFGMNWSEYSRFVGDIFGAPLAIEALMAFFLESTLLGVWIFGWDKLSKGLHAAVMWLVALGSNLSAVWILIANSFMQEPVGYVINNGRAEMNDFAALVFNPNVGVQVPHTILAGICTGAFFILGISAYHLIRKNDPTLFQKSFQIAAIVGVISSVLLLLNGHTQTQHMVETQPMKIAAAEALWETENPASFSVITIGDLSQTKEIFSFRIPKVLSLLAYNQLSGEVRGIYDLQEEYVQTYGPGNYSPPIAVIYWTFRIMVGAGLAMILGSLVGLIMTRENKLAANPKILALFSLGIALPYLANASGWIMTEMGRFPWVVYGLMKIEDGVSTIISAGQVLTSLIGYTLVYGALMMATIYLLSKYARAGTKVEPALAPDEALPSLVGAHE